MVITKEIVSACRKAVEQAGSQSELSRQSGVSQQSISQICSGARKRNNVSKATFLRLFPYLYHTTPTAREALNYQKLQLIGLPMANLLAVGDTRKCFRPESSFIVTEFAENCQDGRAFYPGGELEKETAWRDEFCRRNFELIAKLHDAGIYHRGFTPANELWRPRPAPDEQGNQLDIIWIDVASCRRLPAAVLRRKIPDDFVNFLRFFQFPEETWRGFLQAYCRAVRVKRFEPDQLFAEVRKRLAEISEN